MCRVLEALDAIDSLGRTRKLYEKRDFLSSNRDNEVLKSIFAWVDNPRITFGIKRYTLLPLEPDTINLESEFKAIEVHLHS